MNKFSVRLCELRDEKKLSQGKLATEFGISQNTLSSWEKGKHEPSFDMLVKIAAFFGCTTDYLLGVTDY